MHRWSSFAFVLVVAALVMTTGVVMADDNTDFDFNATDIPTFLDTPVPTVTPTPVPTVNVTNETTLEPSASPSLVATGKNESPVLGMPSRHALVW